MNPRRATVPDTHRLTPERIAALVRQMSAEAGLDPAGAHLIKFTNNAVVQLPAARAVLRIAGSTITRRRIPGVIAAAEWYATHEIPAVRLRVGIEQPLAAGRHLATVWDEVPSGEHPPTPADLAAILRAVHAGTGTPSGIPPWSLPDGIRQRIADADGIDDQTRSYLAAELDDVVAALADLDAIPPLIPPGVIHGDAHLGNVIPSPSGPVICDFDSTSIGRREWDLTPAVVGTARFGYRPDVHRGLVAAYGVDVTTWAGFPVLRRLREFQLVTSVLPVLAANPGLRAQWQHRFATYRSGDDSPWTPYAAMTQPQR